MTPILIGACAMAFAARAQVPIKTAPASSCVVFIVPPRFYLSGVASRLFHVAVFAIVALGTRMEWRAKPLPHRVWIDGIGHRAAIRRQVAEASLKMGALLHHHR